MQKDEIGTILDTVNTCASEAGWIYSCNRDLAEITFVKDIPHHESYEFRIAFAEESPEELIETILEAIDYEMDSLRSPDCVEPLPPNHTDSESECSSSYLYADFIFRYLKTLSENISSVLNMISPDLNMIPPYCKILQTDTKPQEPTASAKAGAPLHESTEL